MGDYWKDFNSTQQINCQYDNNVKELEMIIILIKMQRKLFLAGKNEYWSVKI